MTNVLQVVWGLHIGGAETFLYNVLSKLDAKEYHIDFVIQDPKITNKKLYKLCKKNKWKIYKVPPFNKNLFAYVKAMRMILQKPYDVVHIHMNALINIIPVLLAYRNSKKVIIHSHNSSNNLGGKIGMVVHLINRKILNPMKISNVACSDLAGKWMFGTQEYLLLENAIDIDEYKFSEEKKNKVRKEYGIGAQILIGHVGRFVEAKNHKYILRIFESYVHKNDAAVLMLVGDGPLKDSIVELAENLNISDRVIFVGEKQDTKDYYSAFDCLLFPSLYEGLPFTLVEAQSSGLPVVASDNVTKEIDLTGNIQFLSLSARMDDWISALDRRIGPVQREKCAEIMKQTKYNIESTVVAVKRLYSVQ